MKCIRSFLNQRKGQKESSTMYSAIKGADTGVRYHKAECRQHFAADKAAEIFTPKIRQFAL